MNTSKRFLAAVFLTALLISFTGIILAMGKGMTQSKLSGPSGVLYFSTGASIDKLDLETKKRKEIIPWLDREGRYESNSTYPVYSPKEKKMYFFRSYVWPVRRQLVTFDLKTQKEEEIQELDHYIQALSLSPDGQWFAYLLGGLITDPTGERAEPGPKQLVVRNPRSGEERVAVEGVNPYFASPLWASNEALLYWNVSGRIIRLNIVNQEKKDMGFKGLEPCAISPDRRTVIVIERRGDFDTAIYLLDLEQGKLEFVKRKRISQFSLRGSFIWAPDGKSFVYTRQSWSNHLPFHEVGNLYWYDLATGRETKLANTVSLFSGFWLAEDPAAEEKLQMGETGSDVES